MSLFEALNTTQFVILCNNILHSMQDLAACTDALLAVTNIDQVVCQSRVHKSAENVTLASALRTYCRLYVLICMFLQCRAAEIMTAVPSFILGRIWNSTNWIYFLKFWSPLTHLEYNDNILKCILWKVRFYILYAFYSQYDFISYKSVCFSQAFLKHWVVYELMEYNYMYRCKFFTGMNNY